MNLLFINYNHNTNALKFWVKPSLRNYIPSRSCSLSLKQRQSDIMSQFLNTRRTFTYPNRQDRPSGVFYQRCHERLWWPSSKCKHLQPTSRKTHRGRNKMPASPLLNTSSESKDGIMVENIARVKLNICDTTLATNIVLPHK